MHNTNPAMYKTNKILPTVLKKKIFANAPSTLPRIQSCAELNPPDKDVVPFNHNGIDWSRTQRINRTSSFHLDTSVTRETLQEPLYCSGGNQGGRRRARGSVLPKGRRPYPNTFKGKTALGRRVTPQCSEANKRTKRKKLYGHNHWAGAVVRGGLGRTTATG
jgi:hypothetical protein